MTTRSSRARRHARPVVDALDRLGAAYAAAELDHAARALQAVADEEAVDRVPVWAATRFLRERAAELREEANTP